jgi:hypothetical protein
VRRFAKPLSGVTCSEGSNPSLSATLAPAGDDAPVAQWIERQVADLKVVGSSPAGRANLMGSARADLSALVGAASVSERLGRLVGLVGPAEVVPGWATVEIERAIGPVLRATTSSHDDHLGAFAAVLNLAQEHRVALLEPSTEGPLAAALARHGEGWVAAYLLPLGDSAAEQLRAAGFRLSAAGSGPFGGQRRVLVGRRDGPFILLVDPGGR